LDQKQKQTGAAAPDPWPDPWPADIPAPLDFTAEVPLDGYLWWYVDAISDDGRHGITLIIFVGSVFSPWYAWSRRRGPADPAEHCAVNCALYGPGGRWSMTERGARDLRRTRDAITIGPSEVTWDGTVLTARIDERGAPLPWRLRGTVRVEPGAMPRRSFHLDSDRQHQWTPISPRSRVSVDFDRPALSWSGPGYLDSNRGACPLEASFHEWNWCRARDGEGSRILYNVATRDGHGARLNLAIDAHGERALRVTRLQDYR